MDIVMMALTPVAFGLWLYLWRQAVKMDRTQRLIDRVRGEDNAKN